MAEAAAEAVPAPAKKKKSLVLVILIAALSLGAGGVSIALLLKSRGGAPEHKGGETATAGAAEGHSEAAPAVPDRGVLSLESFISNLADPEGDRYVKCTLRLVLDSREAAELAKSDELSITRIRDRILTLLASKTFADVSSAAGKVALREQVRTGVSEVLSKGKIDEVYFTEFIVQ